MWEYKDLVRPNGPVRYHGHKVVIYLKYPRLISERELELRIGEKEGRSTDIVLCATHVELVVGVGLHALEFLLRLLRNVVQTPNLPVRVGIRATHGAAFVLENLHVAHEMILGRDRFVEARPSLDDRQNVVPCREGRRRELSDGQVVRRMETKDIASATGSTRTQQWM